MLQVKAERKMMKRHRLYACIAYMLLLIAFLLRSPEMHEILQSICWSDVWATIQKVGVQVFSECVGIMRMVIQMVLSNLTLFLCLAVVFFFWTLKDRIYSKVYDWTGSLPGPVALFVRHYIPEPAPPRQFWPIRQFWELYDYMTLDFLSIRTLTFGLIKNRYGIFLWAWIPLGALMFHHHYVQIQHPGATHRHYQ